jgi:hypothetical protein
VQGQNRTAKTSKISKVDADVGSFWCTGFEVFEAFAVQKTMTHVVVL